MAKLKTGLRKSSRRSCGKIAALNMDDNSILSRSIKSCPVSNRVIRSYRPILKKDLKSEIKSKMLKSKCSTEMAVGVRTSSRLPSTKLAKEVPESTRSSPSTSKVKIKKAPKSKPMQKIKGVNHSTELSVSHNCQGVRKSSRQPSTKLAKQIPETTRSSSSTSKVKMKNAPESKPVQKIKGVNHSTELSVNHNCQTNARKSARLSSGKLAKSGTENISVSNVSSKAPSGINPEQAIILKRTPVSVLTKNVLKITGQTKIRSNCRISLETARKSARLSSGRVAKSAMEKISESNLSSKDRRSINREQTVVPKPTPVPVLTKKASKITDETRILSNSSISLEDHCNNNTEVYKPKLPIWERENTTIRTSSINSKRLSKRLYEQKNEGVYEFAFDSPVKKDHIKKPNGDEANIKNAKRQTKRCRPAVKKEKKKFKGTVKSTLLTTDLTWETLLTKNFPVNKFYSKANCIPSAEVIENSVAPTLCADFDIHSYDEGDVDDAGYEASVSMAYETNDTTNMTSVNGSNRLETGLHLISSNFPTPKVSGRFIGTTSTPRGDYLEEIICKPPCVQEEMKICFGFDEPEDKCNFGFSPVPKSYLSDHHFSDYMSSDVGGIEPQPTRFAVPLRPHTRQPLIQVQNRQNIQSQKSSTYAKFGKLKLKERVKINKSDGNKQNYNVPLVPDAAPCSQTILFDNIEDENIDVPVLSCVSQNTTCEGKKVNSMTFMMSPPKNFIKPPRKSYSRDSIEAVKKNFHIAMAGGYSTTGSDTEGNEENFKEKVCYKRKKKLKTLKSVAKNKSLDLKQRKDATGKEKGSFNMKNLTANQSQSGSDKSADDWVSDVNNHFSEVEEISLIVE